MEFTRSENRVCKYVRNMGGSRGETGGVPVTKLQVFDIPTPSSSPGKSLEQNNSPEKLELRKQIHSLIKMKPSQAPFILLSHEAQSQ